MSLGLPWIIGQEVESQLGYILLLPNPTPVLLEAALVPRLRSEEGALLLALPISHFVATVPFSLGSCGSLQRKWFTLLDLCSCSSYGRTGVVLILA